jgi:predicted outer membrane repeat protein
MDEVESKLISKTAAEYARYHMGRTSITERKTMKQIPLKNIFILSLILGVLFSSIVHARTFRVNDTSDAVDVTPGDGLCFTAQGGRICSLRAAIMEANAWAGTDTVSFVNAGTYALTLVGTDDVAQVGDLDITAAVTIAGITGVIIDASAISDRVFDVRSAVGVNFYDMTLRGGKMLNSNGGGIFSNGGSLVFRNLVVEGNSAYSGGGLYLSGGSATVENGYNANFTSNTATYHGGAIYLSNCTFTVQTAATANFTLNSANRNGGGFVVSSNATLSLDGVTVFTSNVAEKGGAIYQSGLTTLKGTVFESNSATTSGGAGYQSSGTLTVNLSDFRNNTSDSSGGAIYQSSGTLSIEETNFSENSTTSGSGGALLSTGNSTMTLSNSLVSRNTASVGGGGLDIWLTTASLNNTTVTNNIASGGIGGGIYNHGGTLNLNNVTVYENSSSSGGGIYSVGTTTVRNSIIAHNTATVTGNDCHAFGGVPILSADFNFIGTSDGCSITLAGDDKTGTNAAPIDPLLEPLANNGGSTETHALQSSSPVINGGNSAGCGDGVTIFTTDQRGSGYSRTVGGSCDIGAYEVN